ncbi:uncharacterized protein LOC141750576 [Larus michahellis]|uniref:uncharacterized protein LOC141750576 n=1 Tax=Larus michahellis TaxID=119627 RepID=UPI003D9B4408
MACPRSHCQPPEELRGQGTVVRPSAGVRSRALSQREQQCSPCTVLHIPPGRAGPAGAAGRRSLHGNLFLRDALWKAPAQRSCTAARSVRSPATPEPSPPLEIRNLIKNRARDSPLRGLCSGAARQDGGTLHGTRVAGDHSATSPRAQPQLLPGQTSCARRGAGAQEPPSPPAHGCQRRASHSRATWCRLPWARAMSPATAGDAAEETAVVTPEDMGLRVRAALQRGAGVPFPPAAPSQPEPVHGSPHVPSPATGRMRPVPFTECSVGGGRRGWERSCATSSRRHGAQSPKGPWLSH